MSARRKTETKRPSDGAELKASAVRLIVRHDRSASQDSHQLGMAAPALCEWLTGPRLHNPAERLFTAMIAAFGAFEPDLLQKRVAAGEHCCRPRDD